MRRWDRLLDTYMDEYRARGICQATVAATASRLHRWGWWLKKRRPRVAIEEIGAELIMSVARIESRGIRTMFRDVTCRFLG